MLGKQKNKRAKNKDIFKTSPNLLKNLVRK